MVKYGMGGFGETKVSRMIEKMLREAISHRKDDSVLPSFLWPPLRLFTRKKRKNTLEALRAKIKEKGCDAVITGNGC